jgi:hypothetical protein
MTETMDIDAEGMEAPFLTANRAMNQEMADIRSAIISEGQTDHLRSRVWNTVGQLLLTNQLAAQNVADESEKQLLASNTRQEREAA